MNVVDLDSARTTSNEERQAAASESLLRQLTMVWLDFERRLSQVPIIRRLETGNFTIEDYKTLLRNLRPQVIEGSRWITRAASSFTAEHAELRSKVIGHAYDEHRDYEMLERDYVSVGGDASEIRSCERNIGTEALAAFLMNQASQANPIDLLGAMFIIEGLGEKMATRWATQLQSVLRIPAAATSFLAYHGRNDESHINKMHAILTEDPLVLPGHKRIIKTARVVARLYLLQLEEIDNV
ncbi:MAG TPA: iron-containing redox enzyme family protein [Oculatellaceae cyanobacterium]